MVDMEYIESGMFTRFIPNTPSGIEAWNVIAKDDGCAAVLSIHAKGVIAQLRKAGYSVAKAKKVQVNMNEIFAELEELGV